jgi:L-ascorbate 6-phosphate lactonase
VNEYTLTRWWEVEKDDSRPVGRLVCLHRAEAATPDRLTIWYLGCNGFVLRSSEVTLYVDLYFGDGDQPNIVRMISDPLDSTDATTCDAVLVSHEHIKHMHPPSSGPLVNDLGADLFPLAAAYE